MRDVAAARRMVDGVRRALDGPNVLGTNAVAYPHTPFLELSPEEWDAVLDTNLKGVLLTCQAAAQALVAAGRGGRIVAVDSGAATTALWGWAHYCASKVDVDSMTTAMALELGGHDIQVNAVLPGYVDVEEGGRHLDPGCKAAARAAIPVGRAGEPADVASAVQLLASPLTDFVNGASLAVDGGSGAGRPGVRPAGG